MLSAVARELTLHMTPLFMALTSAEFFDARWLRQDAPNIEAWTQLETDVRILSSSPSSNNPPPADGSLILLDGRFLVSFFSLIFFYRTLVVKISD